MLYLHVYAGQVEKGGGESDNDMEAIGLITSHLGGGGKLKPKKDAGSQL